MEPDSKPSKPVKPEKRRSLISRFAFGRRSSKSDVTDDDPPSLSLPPSSPSDPETETASRNGTLGTGSYIPMGGSIQTSLETVERSSEYVNINHGGARPKDSSISSCSSSSCSTPGYQSGSTSSNMSAMHKCHSIEEMEEPIVGPIVKDQSLMSVLNESSMMVSTSVDCSSDVFVSMGDFHDGMECDSIHVGTGVYRTEDPSDHISASACASKTSSEVCHHTTEHHLGALKQDSNTPSEPYDEIEVRLLSPGSQTQFQLESRSPQPEPKKLPKICLIETVSHAEHYDDIDILPSADLTGGSHVKSLINMIENQNSDETPLAAEPRKPFPPPPRPPKLQPPVINDDNVYEEVSVSRSPGRPRKPPKRSPGGSAESNKKRTPLRRGKGSRGSSSSVHSNSTEGDNSEEEEEESWMEWSDYDDEETEYENLEDYRTENVATMDKDHQVVYELMTTEKTYVEKLWMLQQARWKTEKVLGQDIAKKMFPYIENIYQLHKENMLPHLQERVKLWEGTRRIGDIMKRFAPFLKLYTDYVKNFDRALDLVEQWFQKSPEFAKMIKSLQPTGPQGIKAQIKAHMLEPVQRVPRYELLLKQYLKYLPENSPDRADVDGALASVSEAARHFESRIQHETQIGKLIALQQQIDSPVSIVTSSRELVKQGKILKVCAKSGKAVHRYLFLFNDLVLLCKEQFIHIPGITPKYQVKLMMELDGMQITDGDNLDTPCTFYLKTRQKALELAAEDEDEKGDWTQILWKVVGAKMRENLQKKLNRRTKVGSIALKLSDPDSLGKAAPVFVHNSQVSQCMLCAKEFKTFKKKHHCKACGAVICGLCSSRSVVLEYVPGRERRVCDECYLQLKDNDLCSARVMTSKLQQARSRELCLFSEYVQLSSNGGRSWQRRFLEIHEGGVLFCFKAQQDICPMASVHLAESEVSLNTLKEKDEKVVRLTTPNKEYYFRDSSSEKLLRWLDSLGKAIEEAKKHT